MGLHSANRKTSRLRKWMFRLAAIGSGLSLFALVELACRVAGWGRPSDYPDPYVGFSEVHPLFVRSDDGTRMRIAKSRRTFFARDSFPARKGNRSFRIFVLGGSTVQGRPYSTPTSFPTWLRLSLAAGDDRRNWEAVNCGGISYASYRLVPILQECLGYEPDLFVICTGHNEFLEDRTYPHIKHAPRAIAVPVRHLSRLRTVTLMRSLVSQFRGDGETDERPVLPADTSPMLDAADNRLKGYRRDDAWHAGVVEHFEFNLRRMIHLARTNDVSVLLVLPPSNLRDSPPFKSEISAELSPAKQSRWRSLIDEARTVRSPDLPRAIALLERALRIDSRHAGTWYLLGRWCDAQWQTSRDDQYLKKAGTAFLRARDEDICPLRMVSPLETAMRRAAEETGTPLIDAHALLESHVPDGVLGNDLLVDHIHPSPVAGHQMIAQAVAEQLRRQGMFHPAAGWRDRRESSYRRHLAALTRDETYFARGQRTLRALDAWTKGRAEAPVARTRRKSGSRKSP